MTAPNATGADRANDRPRQDQSTKNSVHSAAHVAEAQAEFWASRIVAAHRSSVRAIIETGCELIAAKAKLAHGEWGRLTGETTRRPMLPFGWTTVQRLMQIAANPVLANPAHCAGLPASWGTLAALARLPEKVLEQHLDGGAIHADMTRAQAEELVEDWRLESSKPDPQPAPPPEPPQADAPQAAERARQRDEATRQAFRKAQEEAARRAYKQASQRARREDSAARSSPVLMTSGDFRMILGCLHPDHQPDDRKAKYTKAFQIFKDLEGRLVGAK